MPNSKDSLAVGEEKEQALSKLIKWCWWEVLRKSLASMSRFLRRNESSLLKAWRIHWINSVCTRHQMRGLTIRCTGSYRAGAGGEKERVLETDSIDLLTIPTTLLSRQKPCRWKKTVNAKGGYPSLDSEPSPWLFWAYKHQLSLRHIQFLPPFKQAPLCGLGWPESHCVDYVALELTPIVPQSPSAETRGFLTKPYNREVT